MTGFFKLLLVAVISSTLYAKSDILIEPEKAIELIGNEDVMFVSGDSPDIYSLYHIVGSVEMYAHHLHHSDNMGQMHCAPLFMCPDEAEEYISSKGITKDMKIIAYDNFRGPNATGVYHFFKSFGHEDVQILNGGFDAIKALDPNQEKYDELEAEFKAKGKKMRAAYRDQEKGSDKYKQLKAEYEAYKEKMEGKLAKIEKTLLVQKGKEGEHKHTDYTINESDIDTSYIAGKEEVYAAMQKILKEGKDKSDHMIIDSRGMTEIIGQRAMDNVARAGHVPGATFIEWKNITDFDEKRSFRDLEAMEEFFKSQGITKDKTIYAYCHVGAGRSSHIITALQLLGYDNVKVYTGSWDEWGNDMNLPIRR